MNQISYSEEHLKIISEIVYKTSGIIFKDSNMTVLISRLNSKLKEKNINIDEYIDILKKDRKELINFVDFITTNYTSFFRNPRQFEILSKDILPEIILKNQNEKFIKIWSAGCSTGEEPYTIMMVVEEFFEKNSLYNNNWNYKIIGSDLSLESLFIAKSGKFPEKSVSKIDNYLIDKYFIKTDNEYIIKENYKKNIQFDYHNLIYDNGIRDTDIVFCRNVLIYFDENVQKTVLDNIYLAMKNNGYLFLGHSESLIGFYNKFKPINKEKGIIYVKQ